MFESMFNHYLKLAIRDLLKNKYYTAINVLGLVFGMLSALIIAKYIGGLLDFDNFHEKKVSIYSVSQEESIHGNPQKSSQATYWGVGELIRQYPEVIASTRYNYHIESMIIADDAAGNSVSFFENKIFSVDPGFLKIFTFPFRYGNPETALSRPNSIVITTTASERYFGKINPVGKTLTMRAPWGAETSYEVTGVTDDVPQRSQFRFDFLVTHLPLDPTEFWYVPDCSTFVLLKGDANTAEFAAKLTEALGDVPQLKSTGKTVVLSLQSLADVQLPTTAYLLIAVGIFIILISWVNYINQVVAQSYWRMKEIGILRVMGATRTNLNAQFAVESSLIGLTSLVMIVLIYVSLEPYLLSFTNGHLLPLFGDPTPVNTIFLAIFILGLTLTAAVPTVILSSPNFGATLQNPYSSKIGNIGLRQALVVVQFSISTVLMISVFVISNQLEYMNKKDRGFDIKNVLVVRAPIVKYTTWNAKRKTLELFKEKCKELPSVTEVTSSTTVPGEEYRQETYLSLQDHNNKSMVHQNGIDEHFFELYDVNFIAGRNFVPDAQWKNRSSIILNESAARALGIGDFETMINTKITDHESNEVYNLIGIVNDYHQTSVKYKMRPIAFKYNTFRGHFSLKIKAEGLNDIQRAEKISAIEQYWKQTYQDAPFEYFFLDEKFAAQDREDQYFGKLFNYFTILSIIISCSGLFGLSLMISTKRQKEIGVRKVFGADSFDILISFLRGYVKPLSVSVVIGSPAAYLLMSMWLENFAYKIEIGLGLMSLAWLALTITFLFTVSYHTIRSSVANPVTILRN